MRRIHIGMLLVALAMPAGAADTPISAVKLTITRSSSGVQKLTFVSKDVHAPFPSLGGPDDPSVAGATVTLVTPNAAPVTLVIPSGIGNPGWRVRDGSTLDAYDFRNSSAPAGPSALRSAKIREKKSVKLVARATGLSLDAPLGSVGVRVTTGSLRMCALFEGASVRVDVPGRFVAKGAVAMGTGCDDADVGASTTSTSTTSSTTTTITAPCGLLPQQCRFAGPFDVPCNDPAATCVVDSPQTGWCLTSEPRGLFMPCGDGTPPPGTCCPGLVCAFQAGLVYDTCRLPAGASCGPGFDPACAPPLECVGGVCS